MKPWTAWKKIPKWAYPVGGAVLLTTVFTVGALAAPFINIPYIGKHSEESIPSADNSVVSEIDTSALTEVKPSSTKSVSITAKVSNGTISSEGITVLLDSLISNHNAALEYAQAYEDTLDYYYNGIAKSRSANTDLLVNDSDLYLSSLGDHNEKIFSATLTYTLTKKSENALAISELSSSISNLRSAKTNLPKSMTPAQYESEYKRWFPYFDSVKAALTKTHNGQQGYLDNMRLVMEKLSESQDSFNSYMNSGSSYGYSSSATYSQPTLLPIIQMPKTTYCTMRSTGVSGSYDISCN